MAREYRFLTTWCVEAPADAVFDALEDCAAWPQWWPGVRRAELLQEGDADGTGRLWHYVWRSRLPYDLAFDTRIVRVERPWLMEGRAEGELVGVGRWRLSEAPGDRGALRVAGADHAALDEPDRAGRPPRVRLEPRRGHAPGRR